MKKGSELDNSFCKIINDYLKYQTNTHLELKIILTHCDLSDKSSDPQNDKMLLTRIENLEYEWNQRINEKQREELIWLYNDYHN